MELEKAFDRVDRGDSWQMRECCGMRGNISAGINGIHKQSIECNRVAGNVISCFGVTNGA